MKFDGSVVKVVECLVGDSTGCGILIARNGAFKVALNKSFCREVRLNQGREYHNCDECFSQG